MKSVMNTNSKVKAALAVMTLATLVGCGSSKTNPSDDYPGLKDSVPPSAQTASSHAQFVTGSYYQMLPAVRNFNFVEGHTSSYIVQPVLSVSGIEVGLVAKDLPKGATFVSIGGGQYRLTWTPVGVLADQQPNLEIPIQVELQIVSVATDALAARIAGINRVQDFTMTVAHSVQQPVIEKYTLSSPDITEGGAEDFTVTVKMDTVDGKQAAPYVFVSNDIGQSKESLKVDAAHFVTVGQAQSLGNGRYSFKGRFDSQGIKLPGTTGDVRARFVMIAASAGVSLLSPEQIIEIVVHRKAAPAADTPVAAPAVAAAPNTKSSKNAPAIAASQGVSK